MRRNTECQPIKELFKKLVIHQGYPILLYELTKGIDRYEAALDVQEEKMKEKGTQAGEKVTQG